MKHTHTHTHIHTCTLTFAVVTGEIVLALELKLLVVLVEHLLNLINHQPLIDADLSQAVDIRLDARKERTRTQS